jgi:hypothetical protein
VAWTGAVLSGMYRLCDGCVVEQFFPFNTDQAIEIGLVDMNHAKAVDLIIPRFFLDHHVNDGFPSIECVTVANGVVDELHAGGNNGFATGIKDFSFWGRWVQAVRIQ